MVASISPAKLAEIAGSVGSDQKVLLIDVRTPAEFREIHIPFAQNHPLDRLSVDEIRRHGRENDPVYVVCRSGSRGSQACQKLEEAGWRSVVNVEGGTLAWEAAGLPVARGKKTISLERQVRIAAGSLVLLGAGLGLAVHPAWVGLSAFVGAGLIFAGVTDTCGMAMMLARMPWNQVPAGSSGSATGGSLTCAR
jgi:rhodanese-related sulfurtransferase